MPAAIEAAIQEILRPLIEADGGKIAGFSLENGAVEIHLSGACCGCPGFQFTRSQVIEPLLRRVSGDPELEVRVKQVIDRRGSRGKGGEENAGPDGTRTPPHRRSSLPDSSSA